MKKTILTLSVVAILVTLTMGVAACGTSSADAPVELPTSEMNLETKTETSTDTNVATRMVTSTELSQSEVEALEMALDDEYKAWSTYQAVIDKFGDVRPFANIIGAEESHIAALKTLFERYGLDVPENEWVGNVPEFDTVNDACHGGVDAEIENAALYDELFSMIEHEDILEGFHNLRDASLEQHLPAFERCAR